MARVRTSEVTAYFETDLKSVWNAVTNNHDYKWRSDINRIDILNNGKEFVEYTHSGIATKFTITKMNEYSEYEFSMGNRRFTGFWTGYFQETETGGTKIVFTENILIKNPIIRFLSYIFMDLKKMQNTYISDLKNKLGEQG